MCTTRLSDTRRLRLSDLTPAYWDTAPITQQQTATLSNTRQSVVESRREREQTPRQMENGFRNPMEIPRSRCAVSPARFQRRIRHRWARYNPNALFRESLAYAMPRYNSFMLSEIDRFDNEDDHVQLMPEPPCEAREPPLVHSKFGHQVIVNSQPKSPVGTCASQ